MQPLRAAYSSPWIPPPVLEACAFTPEPVYGSGSSVNPEPVPASGEGICPWAKSFAKRVSDQDFDAVIMTTSCDQMRRTAESLEGQKDTPLFLLTVPSTCTTSALHLYQSEILRLASFLSGISGAPATASGLSAAASKPASPHAPRMPAGTKPVPLCILGSHLPVAFEQFEKLLNNHGGYIAVNGTENGPAFQPEIKINAGTDSAAAILESIAEQYFFWSKDAFRRPNNAFYRWLSLEMKREMPKGIILARNCWCDKWAVEGVRIREWSKLPMLELEFTSNTLPLSALSRLEAFMETCSRSL